MKGLIETIKKHNIDEVANRARLKEASKDDLELLGSIANQCENIIEAKLTQIESISKAVQVACIDADGSGIYDHQADGFNFAYWLSEEVQTLQTLAFMQSDFEYMSREPLSTEAE